MKFSALRLDHPLVSSIALAFFLTGCDPLSLSEGKLSPPDAPQGVSASPGEATATIRWNAVEGAAQYNLYWSTLSGSGVRGTKITGVSSPYFHTGITNGITYYYVVTSVNASGESSASSQAEATPNVPAPGAPSDVTAVADYGSVLVSWGPVEGASSYNVYCSTTSGAGTDSEEKIHGVTTPFTHPARQGGITYYYVVTAVGESGVESAPSGQISATAIPVVKEPPKEVTALADDGKVTLTWSKVGGADSYDLFWSTSPGVGSNGNVIKGVTSPFTHEGRANGTKYFYALASVIAGTGSALSMEVSATPQIAIAGAPSGVNAEAGDAQITVTWGPVQGATSYNLYWSTTSGTGVAGTKVAGVSSPFVHTERTVGTTYYYVVTAETPEGESPASHQDSATTEIWIPASPSLRTETYDGRVDLFWDAVPGAKGYLLYWSNTSGSGTMGTQVPRSDNLSYQMISVVNGLTYYFVVTAFNNHGESLPSIERSATPLSGLPRPIMLTGLKLTAGNASNSLEWGLVNATSYNIYWTNDLGLDKSAWNKITGVSAPPYVHTGLTNGTQYHYEITGVNSVGESPRVLTHSLTPRVPAPTTPTNLTATAGDTTVLVSWNPVDEATSYSLYWRSSASSGTKVIYGVSSPYLHTGLTNGATYCYRVTAVNETGGSPQTEDAIAVPHS